MIGLALAGGGARGAYQIGVYLALKKAHIKIDGFMGTSIGAFNAAMLASKREKELLEFWQNINVGKILGLSDKLIAELNDKKVDLGLVKESIINFKNILFNKGINITELKNILEQMDIAKTLYKSNKDFGLVTVRLKDLKPLFLFKKDIKEKLLDEYIIASCYLPIFKFEKIIDNNYYLDGGFYDNLPVNALLNKGYDKIYAVDLKAIGRRQNYIDRNKVIEIKPSHSLGGILNTDREKINDNIKLGYYDTLKIVKGLDGFKYIFKIKNKWYYDYLVRKVNKNVLEDMQKIFKTTNNKILVIKALEYVMKQQKLSYFEIYKPYSVIKKIKGYKKYGVYKFINQLCLFW